MRLVDADALKEAVDNGWKPDMMVSELWEIIDEAPTIGGWVSVKDRLPEETNCYLVHLINNYGIELDVYNVSDGRFHRNPGLVDYWMEILPLPEPPEEVSGDG